MKLRPFLLAPHYDGHITGLKVADRRGPWPKDTAKMADALARRDRMDEIDVGRLEGPSVQVRAAYAAAIKVGTQS
jgi:hypothetical protein